VRNKLGTISLLVVGLLGVSISLFAHHGNASYDTEKTVTVKGAVTEYIWANPHVFLKVDAKDDSGNTLHWVIEAQNIVAQSELGWTNTMFKPGDQVVIDVTPTKNGRPIGRFRGRIVINGQEFKPLGR
jgi:predicted RNA-binding protein (virulence factor B family)